MNPNMKNSSLLLLLLVSAGLCPVRAADVYKEPHVRYLIADMTLGGSPDYYKQHVRDAVPAVALKEWEAGARLVNTNQFERRRIPTPYGESMRVVFKGTEQTATGADLLLTTDLQFDQAPMRLALADLTLGRPVSFYEAKKADSSVAEALKRWGYGARAVNTNLYAFQGTGEQRRLVYRANGRPLDGALVKLNTDPHFSDDWRRYLIAEIQLAGTREKVASFGHRFHDYNCLVAVAHYDAGHRVANLDRFEFNGVDGKPGVSNVVYRGTGRRVTPADIRLTSDPEQR